MGVIGSIVGIGLAAAAVLNRRSTWVKFSLADLAVIFLVLAIAQGVAGTIVQLLPVTLLEFVMVLFCVELLTAGSWYRDGSSNKLPGVVDVTRVEEFDDSSVFHAFHRVSRAGLLFASCYVVSLGVFYLSSYATLAMPLLSDVSLYMIVVSVALALLVLSREE